MDSRIAQKLMYPEFWLVFGLEWPESSPDAPVAEAAFAFAPDLVLAQSVPKQVEDVAGFAGAYYHEHPGRRAVWFSDVTRWLDASGQSWDGLGVDWLQALDDIPRTALGLYLTISRRAYMHLVNTAEISTVIYPNRASEQLTAQEREAVHDAMEEQLVEDWPLYVQESIARGLISVG